MLDKRNKNKVILIGPYPPPYGGIGVHICRVSALMCDEFTFDFIDESKVKKEGIFNILSFNIFKYFAILRNCDIIHVHSSDYRLRFFHLICAKILRRKTIITVHSYKSIPKFLRKGLDNFSFYNSDLLIAVSEEISEKIGYSALVKEAFIPPLIESQDNLPDFLVKWINARKGQKYTVCCGNAWKLDEFNNEDLYGLDLCINAAIEFRRRNINIAFVFIVCTPGGKISIQKYKNTIEDNDLHSSFLLYESPLSFVALASKCDTVIRPTNTDGDALTIREGLFLKKQVVASDVVQRPPGTILFRNRDVNAFMECLIACHNADDNTLHEVIADPVLDAMKTYKDFYKKIYALDATSNSGF